jgi:hypothetical protein
VEIQASTGNQVVALETSNDAASSEQLPKLPKLPEKTSDICTHSDLNREDHRKETLDLTSEHHRQEALAAVKRGDSVRVLSATLGESVYWVRDEQTAERLKRAPDYQGEVCYTLAELQKLAGQSPEFLRDIHQFKKTFGATLEKINQGVNARSRNTVRCGDCQHFERVDRPHMGRCAKGHGRHWLWDTDRRECADFEAAVEGRP